jgi:hypothetical protein
MLLRLLDHRHPQYLQHLTVLTETCSTTQSIQLRRLRIFLEHLLHLQVYLPRSLLTLPTP